MKRFFKWLEGDKTRGRRVVLLGTIFIYLLVTVILFSVGSVYDIPSGVKDVYLTFTATVISVYGFYTGTSSEKSGELADKAADILIKRMDEFNENENDTPTRRA